MYLVFTKVLTIFPPKHHYKYPNVNSYYIFRIEFTGRMPRRSGETEKGVMANSDNIYGAERLLEQDGIGRATTSGRSKINFGK